MKIATRNESPCSVSCSACLNANAANKMFDSLFCNTLINSLSNLLDLCDCLPYHHSIAFHTSSFSESLQNTSKVEEVVVIKSKINKIMSFFPTTTTIYYLKLDEG